MRLKLCDNLPEKVYEYVSNDCELSPLDIAHFVEDISDLAEILIEMNIEGYPIFEDGGISMNNVIAYNQYTLEAVLSDYANILDLERIKFVYKKEK